MALPSFAVFPPSEFRRDLPPAEWQACLDAWTTLSDLYLRLNDEEFFSSLENGSSLPEFLITFFKELARSQGTTDSNLDSLRKNCFLLVHRIFSGSAITPSLLHWTFLADVSHAFPRSERLRELFTTLWKTKTMDLEQALQKPKTALTKSLESKNPQEAKEDLSKLCHLLNVSSDAGVFMFTGSDFLDSLCTAYPKVQPKAQSNLVAVAYLGLMSFLKAIKHNYSVLSDLLYSLKTNAEQQQNAGNKDTLLAQLVSKTPILAKLRDVISASEGARVKSIVSSLEAFQQGDGYRPKKLVRRKIDKGKGKAKEDEYGHGAYGEIHVHRMSLITQIQELFPDLGSGFIIKLLDEYNDNVELVTAHLLEETLPTHLSGLDRTEQLPIPSTSKPHFTPRSTPPPTPLQQRRNIFDNDAFDNLAIPASQLHIGRKNADLTADKILSDRSSAPNKAAILSALTAFDSDDDERDDTYDVEDVGGMVDTSIGADETDANEEALFRAYNSTPEVFGRDSATRRGKARLALKNETGMTDEAIEGWGIMIGRDPKRLRRLENRFATFSGQQRELVSTAYRANAAAADTGTEGETSGAEGSGDGRRGGRGGRGGGGGFPAGRGRGQGQGRGRGGGRGGAGNVAGASDDKNTQVARQKKESNKGSRANHNRRDARARKMQRGGLPG